MPHRGPTFSEWKRKEVAITRAMGVLRSALSNPSTSPEGRARAAYRLQQLEYQLEHVEAEAQQFEDGNEPTSSTEARQLALGSEIQTQTQGQPAQQHLFSFSPLQLPDHQAQQLAQESQIQTRTQGQPAQQPLLSFPSLQLPDQPRPSHISQFDPPYLSTSSSDLSWPQDPNNEEEDVMVWSGFGTVHGSGENAVGPSMAGGFVGSQENAIASSSSIGFVPSQPSPLASSSSAGFVEFQPNALAPSSSTSSLNVSSSTIPALNTIGSSSSTVYHPTGTIAPTSSIYPFVLPPTEISGNSAQFDQPLAFDPALPHDQSQPFTRRSSDLSGIFLEPPGGLRSSLGAARILNQGVVTVGATTGVGDTTIAASVSAHLDGVDLSGVPITPRGGIDLTGIDLSGVNVDDLDLGGVDLRGFEDQDNDFGGGLVASGSGFSGGTVVSESGISVGPVASGSGTGEWEQTAMVAGGSGVSDGVSLSGSGTSGWGQAGIVASGSGVEVIHIGSGSHTNDWSQSDIAARSSDSIGLWDGTAFDYRGARSSNGSNARRRSRDLARLEERRPSMLASGSGEGSDPNSSAVATDLEAAVPRTVATSETVSSSRSTVMRRKRDQTKGRAHETPVEHLHRVLGGYRATLNNPRVSEEARENAALRITELTFLGHIPDDRPLSSRDEELHRNRVIGGHMAALKNTKVSEFSRANSLAVLRQMGVDPAMYGWTGSI